MYKHKPFFNWVRVAIAKRSPISQLGMSHVAFVIRRGFLCYLKKNNNIAFGGYYYACGFFPLHRACRPYMHHGHDLVMTWITRRLLAPKVTNNGRDTTVDST